MRDTHLALALLGAANGLQAGLSPGRLPPMMAMMIGLATGLAASRLAAVATDHLLVAACAMSILSAGACWLPQRARPLAAGVVLSLCSGLIAGHLAMASDLLQTAGFAGACVFAVVATVALRRRGWSLAVLVVAGWLIAIGTLNLTLTVLPVTPGYAPDHLE